MIINKTGEKNIILQENYYTYKTRKREPHSIFKNKFKKIILIKFLVIKLEINFFFKFNSRISRIM